MSSWFSFPNPFNSEDDDDTNSYGARDQNISSLIRGVAAFLAPPPTNSRSAAAAAATDDNGGKVEVSSKAIAGMKHDLVEIGHSFKSGLSLLSSHLFKLKDDAVEEAVEEEMIGITEEVVHFVSTLSEKPQLWTDFPISLPDDFEMSGNQREHAENIEQLVPGLGSLRQKVSGNLPDNKFWMIYFILLLPRLDENDLELLSTPKIVKVRDTLLQQLQNKNAQGESSKDSETQHSSLDNIKDGGLQGNNNQLPKTTTLTEASKAAEIEVSNDEKPKLLFKDEDDVSFSDLEDNDNDLPDRITGSSKEVPSSGESHEWVHIGGKSNAWSSQQKPSQSTSLEKGSDSEGSSEWLTVDDVDSDTMAIL